VSAQNLECLINGYHNKSLNGLSAYEIGLQVY